MTLTVGSLFAGIGGIDLGLERAGMRTVWQVERDEWCRRVLAKHWPQIERYEDVRDIRWSDVRPADVLCGGFPCQPFSSAGKRQGLQDARWLWPAFRDAIDAIRPRYVVIENAPTLVHSPAFVVLLSDLSALGYDAEWTQLRASAIGAPHPRARTWIVAYTDVCRKSDSAEHDEAPILPQVRPEIRRWPDSPGRVGVDDGLPNRVDRIRGLGNAVVPQVAEWIGRQIMCHASTR